MVDLSLLPDGGVGWLDASGDHADIVLSTRIRLARNVEGYAFTGRARDGERLRVLAQVREAVPHVPRAARRRAAPRRRAAADDRLLLHERHLVSKELAGLDAQHPVRSGAAVFLGDGVGRHGERGGPSSPAVARSGLRVARGVRGGDALDRELGRARSVRVSRRVRIPDRVPDERRARACARRC